MPGVLYLYELCVNTTSFDLKKKKKNYHREIERDRGREKK